MDGVFRNVNFHHIENLFVPLYGFVLMLCYFIGDVDKVWPNVGALVVSIVAILHWHQVLRCNPTTERLVSIGFLTLLAS